MFGLLISSRRPITTITPLSPTQLSFPPIPSDPPFSHLAVFLLPDAPALPSGSAAAVYIQLRPGAEFKLLGALTDEKPSAVFRVRPGRDASADAWATGPSADMDAMTEDGDNPGAPVGGGHITVGISLEPVAQVEVALAAMRAATGGGDPKLETYPGAMVAKNAVSNGPAGFEAKDLAKRIIENAFNYLASFAQSQGGEEVVPLRCFRDWWSKFERRLESDPGFLERG